MSEQCLKNEDVSEPVSLRVLLAHDQLMERDALARTLAILRPCLSTHLIAPQSMFQHLLDDPPDVVIVTTLSQDIEARVPVWILLHEGGSSRCIVSINGQRREHDDLDLSDILDILDEVTL